MLDFTDIDGKEAALLQHRLVETKPVERKIDLIDNFLLKRLAAPVDKIKLVNSIMHDLSQEDFFENINSVASRYGISARYLQKIFIAYAGISPKLFIKITRFQKSLRLVACKSLSLTTIAHACGYFDQAHFIKDFKCFTGLTPSHFTPESSTDFVATYKN